MTLTGRAGKNKWQNLSGHFGDHYKYPRVQMMIWATWGAVMRFVSGINSIPLTPAGFCLWCPHDWESQYTVSQSR
jgi:hypothetical protein